MSSPMGYLCQVCNAAVPEDDIEFFNADSGDCGSGLCPECGSWTKFDAFDDASDDDDGDMEEYNDRRMREKWDDEDDDEDDSEDAD